MKSHSSVTVCLPTNLIATAPDAVQKWLMECIGFPMLSGPNDVEPNATSESASSADELAPVRLAESQVRRFLADPLHKKTRATLRAIAELEPRFRWADLMKKLGYKVHDHGQLRAVWAGLTKRTRTVSGDDEAVLLTWPDWEDREFNEAEGLMDPVTHAAFRRALKVA